jgi:uncharacterized protein (TIGR03083 family)
LTASTAEAAPGAAAGPHVVAHVTTLHRRALDDRRRSPTPADTADLNERCLDEQPSRELAELLRLIERDGPSAHQGLRRVPDELTFPFHAGTPTTIVPASGVLLAEYLVHADDIRRALGLDGSATARHARLALLAIVPLLAAWGVPGDAAKVAVRLIGTDDVIDYRLDSRGLTAWVGTDQADDPVDVEPADWLMTFPFGRRPLPTRCIALAGRLARSEASSRQRPRVRSRGRSRGRAIDGGDRD